MGSSPILSRGGGGVVIGTYSKFKLAYLCPGCWFDSSCSTSYDVGLVPKVKLPVPSILIARSPSLVDGAGLKSR